MPPFPYSALITVALDSANVAHLTTADRRLVRVGQLVGLGVSRGEAEELAEFLEGLSDAL